MEHNRYGLHFMSTDNHLIEDNILRHNSVGIYLMYGDNYVLRRNLLFDNRGPSGYGLGIKEINNGIFDGNRIVNNRVGVYTDMSPVNPNAEVEFHNNLFAYNDIAVTFCPAPNAIPIPKISSWKTTSRSRLPVKGTFAEHWAVDGRGNYWSDYNGFDANHDGVGDLAYETKVCMKSDGQAPGSAPLSVQPGGQCPDLAAKAFPIFQPQPKMADPNPLTVPPALPPVRGMPEPPRLLNLLAGLALGGIGLAGARAWHTHRVWFSGAGPPSADVMSEERHPSRSR